MVISIKIPTVGSLKHERVAVQIESSVLSFATDFLLEDYLLTYVLFVNTTDLCSHLWRCYNNKSRQSSDGDNGKNRMVVNRKHVVNFVHCWFQVDGDVMFQKEGIKEFLKVSNILEYGS